MSELEDKYTDCVGVICFRGNDVLLIQRGTAPREAQAALRELYEETGVRAALGPKVEIILAEFEGFRYRLHDYVAEWMGGQPRAGDDAAKAVFTPPDALDGLGMWPKTREVIETARAMRKPLTE